MLTTTITKGQVATFVVESNLSHEQQQQHLSWNQIKPNLIKLLHSHLYA